MSLTDEVRARCSCGDQLVLLPTISDHLRFQHGENPEHVLSLSWKEILAIPCDVGESREHAERRSLYTRLNDWMDSIHAFEQDGKWVGAPDD